jgi:ubiquinone biosynthesis protein
MMGHIDRQTREDLAGLVYALAQRDVSRTVRALLKLLECDEQPAARFLERDVADFMGRHVYKPLKDLEIGKLLQELLELLSYHHLRIPQDLFFVLKALTTWECVGLSLYPDFDMMERTAPFIEHVRKARMHPERIADDMFESGIDLMRFVREIPGELREVLLQVKEGKLKIEFEHRGLEPMLRKQDQISNRVAFSILIASLIIGSALIVLSRTPPFVFGISLIGIIGFLVATVMGVWLVIAILRKGRL